MAVKFLDPGGDHSFVNPQGAAPGVFWTGFNGGPVLATDFVHGNHKKSYKCGPGSFANVQQTQFLGDTGRISIYWYFNAMPTSATQNIIQCGAANLEWQLKVSSGGVLKLFEKTAQMGSNGPTLVTGKWYRICVTRLITSTTVNRFEVFVDGVSAISVTNATMTNTGQPDYYIGQPNTDTTFDLRMSDFYFDDSNSLTDPGDIWVCAKRPNANGTTNGFTTQIGAGGSGYGTGHSPQVNERPLSATNGWSMIGAGSAITEEYNIEGKNVGDFDLTGATIIDWLGWVDIKSLAGETVQVILDGANNGQAITSTESTYFKIKGSSTYPSGTGADIGITTDTSLTTVSFYECGIVVAFIPAVVSLDWRQPISEPTNHYKTEIISV